MRPLATVAGGTCDYYLANGALEEVPALVGAKPQGRVFVVTDVNVGPLWAEGVAERLDAPILELPAGEKHKRWATVETAVRWLLDGGAERGDLIVAVGGGVVTDMVGFAASVTLRGLPWIAVPTSVMGMVDAALGGKTGIDLDEGKNLVGTFWHPVAVVADPVVLSTLDSRQRRAGLVEAVKAAIIAPSGSLGSQLGRHLRGLALGQLEHAPDVIGAAVRVKAEIVNADEREKGPRAALNLGHTLGHAIEAATGYDRFLHGEAVAVGLVGAVLLARERGLVDAAWAARWIEMIEVLGPYPSLSGVAWGDVAPYLERDKKRAGGEVRWVLPRPQGVTMGVTVAEFEVREVFARIAEGSGSGSFASLV